MPVHDWNRVEAGYFHEFHYLFLSRLHDELNAILPRGFYALVEQHIYLRKRKTIVVRHISNHRIVAVVEMVSPGNKSSVNAIGQFVNKVFHLIHSGCHVLVIELLRHTARDPQGIHGLIGAELSMPEVASIPGSLTLASYHAMAAPVAYVELVSVGDKLADMPLFLNDDFYVNVPLERTYQAAYRSIPEPVRELIDTPRE